jgi:hypothetical protein
MSGQSRDIQIHTCGVFQNQFPMTLCFVWRVKGPQRSLRLEDSALHLQFPGRKLKDLQRDGGMMKY